MVAPLDITNVEEEQDKYEEKKAACEPSGPVEKSRARTDYCWFLVFIVFLVVWALVIISAFARGSLTKWLEPTDSAGRVCGKELEVRQERFLVQYDRGSCEFPECLVCRSHCPSRSFSYGNSSEATMEELLGRMICKPGVEPASASSWEQLRRLVDSRLCAAEYEASNATGQRCDVEDRPRFRGWRHYLPRFNRDLGKAKYSILGFVLLSGLLALLSVFAMRWYTLLYVCGSFCAFYLVIFAYVYEKFLVEAESQLLATLFSLLVFILAQIFIIAMGICFWREIYLACQMIRESSKAITCMASAVLLPLGVALVYLIVFAIAAKAHLYLSTLESPVYRVDFVEEEEEGEACMCPESLGYVQNASCEPAVFAAKCRTGQLRACVLSGCRMLDKQPERHALLHLANFFGIYWSFWFGLGFLDTVLASVFATWYWTYNKKLLSYLTVLESFWRIGGYHLGSVAFGSLIMFACEVIQFMLNATYQILLRINKPTAELTYQSFRCIFDSLDKFFNFVNQRAYVMCAVHGSDFIESGRTSFYLLKRNAEKVVVVFKFTNWIIVILTIVISCTTTKISTSYFARRDDLTYPTAMPFIVFVGSMLVTWMILRIVDIAVNTVFQCFLEDSERNDDSFQKPYFMHDELTKFLYKK